MQGRRVRSSGPVPHAASAITAPDTDHLPVYWQFHEAVTRAQLASWLPSGRHTLVDVSGPRAPGAELAAKAGHTVLRVISAGRGGLWGREDGGGDREGREGRGDREGRGGLGGTVSPQERGDPGGSPPRGRQGRIIPLIADSSRLSFLRDGCADGVIAEDRALSMHLAAEAMIAE